MKKHTRIMSLIICFVMAFSFVLSTLYLSHFAHHHCSGSDCKICCQIHTCEQNIKLVGIASSHIFSLVNTYKDFIYFDVIFNNFISNETLVDLNVKLSC